jgi:peptidyl-prolyl cis-trans isomerase B (cyclophilin B)
VTAALTGAALVLAGCSSTTLGTPNADPSVTSAPAAATTTEASASDLPATTSSLPGSLDTPESIPSSRATMPTRSTPLAGKVSCAYPADPQTPSPKHPNPPNGSNVPATGTTVETMFTSVGQLQLTLDRALAPCAVNSFVSLSKQGYFDNTQCHRMTTVPGLQVLQCGDPSGTGTGGPGYSFKDELFAGMSYGRGVMAMANAGANTNGSQFFIVYGDASGLQPNYTIFGSVDDQGLQFVDEVARAGVSPQNGAGDGPPATPVLITSLHPAS